MVYITVLGEKNEEPTVADLEKRYIIVTFQGGGAAF